MTDSIFIGGGGPDHKLPQTLLLARSNRHGLVAGATGTGKTVTLQVMAEPSQFPRLRHRFLARHPKAQIYVDFPDFAFFRLRPLSLHLNGGFARAFDGPAELILSGIADLADFEALERSAVEHLNTDHAETLALYATGLCGMPPGKWRATGLDPEGLDLALGDTTARVVFPRKVETPGALRGLLKDLADQVRNITQAEGSGRA